MDSKKLVPQIRFKGFHDEWEEKKAEYIFTTINDKNHIELPVLSATQEYGMVERCDSNYNISYNKNNLTTYKKVNKGQFVIHLRSFQGGFAHSNIIGITSPAYTIIDFKMKDNHNDKFWKYILSSEKFIKKLELVTYGIRDGRSINFNDFCILKFIFPVINEQKKISKLFENIDTLISTKQIKLKKIKALKQTLLKKMFPNNNENVPEIRFKGFTENWEKKNFFEVADFISGFSFSSNDFVGTGIPLIKISNIQNGRIKIDSDTAYLPFDFEYIYQKFIIKPNDLLIAMSGATTGKMGMYEFENIALLNQRVGIVRAKNNYNQNFIIYILYIYTDKILKMAYGGAQPNISSSHIYQIKLSIPMSYIEQTKISNYFYKLDKLISLYEKEIEKLTNLKKAFFGKMFV